MSTVTQSTVAFVLTVFVACSSGSGGAPRRGKLIQVHVNVFAWNDARVGAMLIDKTGRRTGWDVDRPIRESAGCIHGYGSEEGLPEEREPGDSLQSPSEPATGAPADTVPGGPQLTPLYHYFTIQDSANAPSVLDQGGCELRLNPQVGGKVQLTLLANGIGFSECGDTTSVWVEPRARTRWWLSWKVAGGRCVVKISPMAHVGPTRRTHR